MKERQRRCLSFSVLNSSFFILHFFRRANPPGENLVQGKAMKPRIIAAGLTVVILILVMTLRLSSKPLPADPAPARGEWPMFGGSGGRNMMQPLAANLPVEWNIDAAGPKNVKWVAELGSVSHSFLVVAGGRVL